IGDAVLQNDALRLRAGVQDDHRLFCLLRPVQRGEPIRSAVAGRVPLHTLSDGWINGEDDGAQRVDLPAKRMLVRIEKRGGFRVEAGLAHAVLRWVPRKVSSRA